MSCYSVPEVQGFVQRTVVTPKVEGIFPRLAEFRGTVVKLEHADGNRDAVHE